MNRETSELNNILYKMGVTDIYGIFHSSTKEYSANSATCGNFSEIDPELEQKTNSNKFRKNEMILCIISNHYAIKLKTNCK